MMKKSEVGQDTQIDSSFKSIYPCIWARDTGEGLKGEKKIGKMERRKRRRRERKSGGGREEREGRREGRGGWREGREEG